MSISLVTLKLISIHGRLEEITYSKDDTWGLKNL
jgi:hypothetical protein